MKGYFIILIFITIVFILNNCNPEYECTAYVDPAVWDSLPNKFHDILTYNNENGNILKIYVGNLEMYAVKECDINDNCQCETHINYVQQRRWMDSEWLIYYNFSAQIQDGIKITWIAIQIQYLKFSYYYPKFETDTISFTKVNDTITINNTFYSGVNIYEADTIKNENLEIWKVWVHKNYGIIKFSDRYDKIEWNLVR